METSQNLQAQQIAQATVQASVNLPKSTDFSKNPETEATTQQIEGEMPSEASPENQPSPAPHENWVPPEKRRPEDEFFDLSTIDPLETVDVLPDQSIVKLVTAKGAGSCIAPEDTVYYRHETRFDNGQLVDLGETRKVADKFIMSDERYHDFLRHAFLTMRKNEICFLRITPASHKNIYHATNLSMQRTEAERERMRTTVGPDIFIKVTVTNIKRDPMCDARAPWEEKFAFYLKVREVGRELCAEGEHSNAKNLYSRCIGIFKNMPKKQRESLDDAMKQQRLEVLAVLNTNCALCMLKKKMPNDAIKHCNEAISYDKSNPKAYYRLSQSYLALNDLDRAKENLTLAIEHAPNDTALRTEYKELCAIKTSKEKEWYNKMSGFYQNPKLAKIERTDDEEVILREKIKRQTFDQ